MPSLAGTVYGILAAVSLDAGAVPVYLVQTGFAATITRTGAGDYTLTLIQAAALATSCIITSGINGTVAAMLSVEPLTTTTLRVRTFDAAGAALEQDFWLKIQQIAP